MSDRILCAVLGQVAVFVLCFLSHTAPPYPSLVSSLTLWKGNIKDHRRVARQVVNITSGSIDEENFPIRSDTVAWKEEGDNLKEYLAYDHLHECGHKCGILVLSSSVPNGVAPHSRP